LKTAHPSLSHTIWCYYKYLWYWLSKKKTPPTTKSLSISSFRLITKRNTYAKSNRECLFYEHACKYATWATIRSRHKPVYSYSKSQPSAIFSEIHFGLPGAYASSTKNHIQSVEKLWQNVLQVHLHIICAFVNFHEKTNIFCCLCK
jgi:hypothetical protein